MKFLAMPLVTNCVFVNLHFDALFSAPVRDCVQCCGLGWIKEVGPMDNSASTNLYLTNLTGTLTMAENVSGYQ